MPTDREQIIRAIRTTNEAWTSGEIERVQKLFHPAAVHVSPDFTRRVEGREAIVRSYEDFTRQAVTREFEEFDHSVDLFGDSAVATYRFRVTYERNGEARRVEGSEILVFRRMGQGWQAIWRTQLPSGDGD
ncbi:MAG: nuclear transport factor 2 family protein [bacterium]